ncbi:MAG: hypothetical protein LKI34_08570 [Bifidobacterium tibiigranuli]|jgi:saccharopine dehydrogenase-like NADP-dependent oxidoreductase|uniref:hypothetical protein n=1 Tax=Bifidobacterium tibiigranuli TaxID=2172043 RepID=UPI0026EFBE19|nr:hypothetical protein [Bifidobacterium tibiigranuli]MCI1674249.1 hypothetical protein [Bifidobacterium tibiigranuli]MCI1713471.1 hypothetical protein [Bifidobacterium tibiigranuli]
MAEKKQRYDYDPMIYDVMRESANRLRGEFVNLSNQADSDAERQAFDAAELGVYREAEQVDAHDVDAVRAKTADFDARINAIVQPVRRHELVAA